MRSLLRKLERRLVAQRAELAVSPPVRELVSRWSEALSQNRPTPDTLEYMSYLIGQKICRITVPFALHYLDACRGKGVLPDEERLIDLLVHGPPPDPFVRRGSRRS